MNFAIKYLNLQSGLLTMLKVEKVGEDMSEWRECVLGDIADIQTGPFGSQLHAADYVDIGTPSIMPTNIGSSLNIIEDSIAKVSDEDLQRLSRYTVKEKVLK